MGQPSTKIMIIEDDPSMVSLLGTLLKLEGYTVRMPKNHHPDHLIKVIIDEQPQIALVDVNLSMGSGLDLVRQIRHETQIKGLSVLMASGLSLKKECMEAGADGFVQKPFMPDELIELIHKVIQPSSELQKIEKE